MVDRQMGANVSRVELLYGTGNAPLAELRSSGHTLFVPGPAGYEAICIQMARVSIRFSTISALRAQCVTAKVESNSASNMIRMGGPTVSLALRRKRPCCGASEAISSSKAAACFTRAAASTILRSGASRALTP